jgi:SAM-dependent methyltransferase
VVGEVVAELVVPRRFVEYPIWMWHWSDPGEAPWKNLVSLPAGEAKLRALDEYRSQTEGDRPVLRDDFLENFRGGVELLIEDAGALPGDYFDATYERNDDPWGLETRWYEERKRALTLAALPDQRFRHVLEIGCGIGVLTAELAHRADHLLAVDVSTAAVERARQRLANVPHVRVQVADVADAVPAGTFDLVVLSEVGYYFDRPTLERVLADLHARLAPGGTLLVCHWRHPVEAYPLTGDEVHRVLRRTTDLSPLVEHREKDLLLDVYGDDHRSVAQRTGLA